VAIYTRVSTDDQSTSTQEHELRQYAKHRNWTVQRVCRHLKIAGRVQISQFFHVTSQQPRKLQHILEFLA
jgi:DNA invertase Pin-like site-specific DNA recombinase